PRLFTCRSNGTRTIGRLSRGLVTLATVAVGLALAGVASARTYSDPPPMVEVVVTLEAPALAQASLVDRELTGATRARSRLALRAPASVAYLRRLASAQATLAGRVTR